MKKLLLLIPCHLLLFATLEAHAASVSVGAAPKGDPNTVAARIIKYNFPQCKRVTTASRLTDGTIRAKCDGIDYRVFTMYVAKEGKMMELAIDCDASKRLLGVSCW